MTMADVDMLRAACCIAGLDKEIHDKERAMLKKLAKEVGVGKVSLNAMIDRAANDSDFYQEQFRILKAEPEKTMRRLFAVAVSDGQVTMEERVILRFFADRLKVDEAQFEKFLAQAESQLDRNGGSPSD